MHKPSLQILPRVAPQLLLPVFEHVNPLNFSVMATEEKIDKIGKPSFLNPWHQENYGSRVEDLMKFCDQVTSRGGRLRGETASGARDKSVARNL